MKYYRIGQMGDHWTKYQAIQIPTSGTFRLVPESDHDRISDALDRTKYLSVPAPEELTVAFLLKHHREAEQLTQEQLAGLSGVGQKHISNIEKGVTVPRWPTLEKLFPHLDPKFETGIKYVWARSRTQVQSA